MGVGWLLVAAVCLGSLLPVPARDIAALLNDKFVHFVSYFVLTVWFSGLYSKKAYYVLIAAVVIALGAALDIAQGTTATRQFDLLDILANAIGALVGFTLAFFVVGGWCARLERWIER